MAERVAVVIVGHVNAGKTTLVRTLARQPGFGAVGTLPGSTLRTGHAPVGEGGHPIDWVDTPGFEDPLALAERFDALTLPGPVERMKALLRQPEVVSGHPNEWRALSAALAGDALLLVVDSVELVLPKHRSSLALLQACGRPVLMLLRRASHEFSQAEAWERAAAEHGLGEVLRFDAERPDPWPRLLQLLSALLMPRHAAAAAALEGDWLAARQRRQQASLAMIGDALVGLAARRETLPASVAGDPALKEQAGAAFREAVLAEVDAAWRGLVARHGFEGHGPASGGLRGVGLRWEDDLFNREVLKDAGGKLTGGAAIGAAIGLGADIALAGLSLGAGTAVGAAVGGVASQGFSSFSRKVLNRLTGQFDLSVEDGVLVGVADGLLALLQALQARGHGAPGAWVWPAGYALDASAQAALLDALQPARGHPEWSAGAAGHDPAATGRQRAVDTVAGLLGALPARAWRTDPAAPAAAGQATAVRQS